jgi:MoaA/NifB/PqqE/SkfB family radical SAM enzyme
MNWSELKILEVSFTTYCNANCPLCQRTDKKTGVKREDIPLIHYDIEKFKRLVDQTDKTSVNAIHLCGDYGDPMMHPHIEEAMDYVILERNKWMAMDTNGGIRDQEFYKRIAEKYNGRLLINFSIDGFDQATNEMYRVDVDFERAKANCTAFAKYNPWPGNCNWQMLIFNFNYHQIDDVAQYCKDNGIMFDFKLNKRHWHRHTVKNPQIIQFVQQKQQEWKHIRYEY